ncbi:hypothetical protein, partial [Treponema sp. R6D11]
MKIKIDLTIFAILIIAVVVTVITISIIMAQITYSNPRKESPNNAGLKKINVNNNDAINPTTPIIDKNTEAADAQKYLLLIVTQRVLERALKSNDKIAFMAVYLDDGTIMAHFKPERIGRNMFDADVEFKDYMQDIFFAINNKSTYKGIRYDPLFNENMKFIVKPLRITSLEQNLTLLIGIYESDIVKEINAVKP